MPTYRADIEYEGTRYHGWQLQANARSVAGELQRAIAGAGGAIVELGASGRTDAGVHALGQTIHLRLERAIDPAPFRLALEDRLPPDIHVRGLWRVADGFHARHDAVARSYVYQISRRRTALAKRFVWWLKRPLDSAAMERALRALEGRHDFRLLCERPGEQASTLVQVEHAQLVVVGDLVLLRFVASHFLWKMVRRTVGVLVRIGTGEAPPSTLADLVAGTPSGEPPVAAWTAPPSGLFLERVLYPDEAPLGALVPPVPVAADPSAVARPFLGATRGREITAPAARRRRAR